MKLKCPVCNGCFDYVWIGFQRFFNCDFCKATYNTVGESMKRVKDITLKLNVNGNEVVDKVTYYEKGT